MLMTCFKAARKGHEEIVEILVRAGARLGGLDQDGGYAGLAVNAAVRSGDQNSLRTWEKSGYNRKGRFEEDSPVRS
jgi:lysophospholipase